MASASSNKTKVKSGNKGVGNQGLSKDEHICVSKSTASRRENSASARENAIHLSFTFVFWSLVSTFSIAFGSGYAARRLLIQQLAAGHPQLLQIPILPTIPKHPELNAAGAAALPPPKVRDDKEVPSTHYSSKITNTTASASAHTILLEKKTGSHTKPTASPVTDKSNDTTGKWQQCAVDENYEAQGETCQVSKEISAKYDGKYTEDDAQEEEDEEEAPHLPAGQHLLVDIKNVNRDFLNSEPRLAQAMVDVVWESDLTLLSYHCHSLLPMGVSCVGVLLESHISFHTWPEAGVITLDLFTCGSGLLLPILPIIKRLFAIPDEPMEGDQSSEPPTIIWVHKLRGFRPQDDATSKFLGQSDLATDVLGVMDLDMKKQIATVKTDFQTVDIWDIIDPKFRDLLSYKKSISLNNDTYEAQHPDLYAPNRQVFLDGMLQSTRMGNEAYHEALVHPGMFTHLSPKRVAIIGGGEGATLREVLKHKSVQHVKMIEIDCIMIQTSREFLPTWNSCKDIKGSTESCFDDPRAEILCEDALSWFMDRYSSESTVAGLQEDKFDVIIMDALDPQDDIPFAEVLYNNDAFTQSLYNALTDNGIVVMQLGVTPDLEDAADQYSKSKNRAKLTNGLSKIGFDSLHAYEESHCGFSDPWSFLVACKTFGCRERFYTNSAAIDLDIRRRILPTISGLPTLKYFDGSTMSVYHIPSKPSEVIYCRQDSPPKECATLQGYDPSIPNIPESSFEVKQITQGSSTRVGLFSKVDISRGSMIVQEKSSNSVHFYPTTTNLIYRTAELDPVAKHHMKGLLTIFDRYAFENNLFGNTGYDMHSSILSLVNHGCNGTYNIGSDDEESTTEETADAENLPYGFSLGQYSKGRWENVFNPIVERHLQHLIGGHDVALRDIAKGEEVLENVLSDINTEEDWKYWVDRLRKICQAEHISSMSQTT